MTVLGTPAINGLSFNPFYGLKATFQFWCNLWNKSKFGKMFDGEILFSIHNITHNSPSNTLFIKSFFNSKVIIKSIVDPDNNFWRNF